MKGALIAGVVAVVVCSIPCVILVVYYRQKRMTSEVDKVGDVEGQDFDSIRYDRAQVELKATQTRKEKKL